MEDFKKGKVLITGAAGFIGYYVSKKLLEEGYSIVGLDNMNDYYDVNLKYSRLRLLRDFKNFVFVQSDIANKENLLRLFSVHNFDYVINLAAQAGVRYSLENPDTYINSNIVGFYNVLEACRCFPVKHLIYASSSSVYGATKEVPFKETQNVDNPISLYAATKKSNELMAYTYSHLYDIPATGLRFFTVYGPLGRPDMAYYIFIDKYFKGEPIRIFNSGDLENDLYRDFTYIDDIVEGVYRLLEKSPVENNYKIKHTVYNIGNNQPVKLMNFISVLEKALSLSLGKEVIFDKIFEPMKAGDVPVTYASIDKLFEAVGFKPITSLEEGLHKFVNWYVEYYKIV